MNKQTLFIFISFVLLCIGSISHAISNNDSSETNALLEPTREQHEASLFIARALTLSHYRKQHIDRDLSEKLYENYP